MRSIVCEWMTFVYRLLSAVNNKQPKLNSELMSIINFQFFIIFRFFFSSISVALASAHLEFQETEEGFHRIRLNDKQQQSDFSVENLFSSSIFSHRRWRNEFSIVESSQSHRN